MDNKNSLEIAYQNARDLIHKKEYLHAISQLNEILKVFPNELNSIYLLSLIIVNYLIGIYKIIVIF